MRFLTRLRLACRDLFRPRTVDREANEELTDWVETLTERHAAHGLSRDAARRAALVELGGLERVKDDARSIRRGVRLETTLQDVRLAARALSRTPGVTAAIVMTFALGLGGNAAIFSVVKTVLIEPLPYRDPDRLMFVWADVTDLGYPRAPLAGPEVADFQAHSKAFESFGGVWSTTSSLSGDGDPEQLRIATVTPEFFKVLGVPAALGEVIGPAHFNQTVRPVLLSHALWSRRYAADPSIVGRAITMNDRPAIVVGVMPADFVLWFPSDSAIPADLQAWVPGSARLPQDPRGQQYLRVVGRLRAGVTTAEAQQEIAAIGAQIVRQWPTNYTPHYRFYSVPMQADTVQSVKPALLVVFAGAGILLLIACVNVAGLLIVRAASRRRDAAVRLALGAGRARLFRQYLVEGLLLAGIGGLVGIALSRAGLQLLVSLAPQRLARIGDAQIDTAVLAFAAVLVCGWAILFSLAPLSEVLRMRLTTALQQAGRAAGIVLQQRSRRLLVVAQIALGVLLLVGAALLGRAFDRLMRIDVGFSSERVITFRVAVPASRYRSLDAQNTFHRRMLESLAGLPGVSSVGAVSHLPYDNLPNWGTPYLPDGEHNPARAGLADARNVAPGFFETVRAKLVAGRFFTEDDAPDRAEIAVVVDDVFRDRVWPGQDAVGKALLIDANLDGEPKEPARVIGVVGHLRHRSITDPGREQIFVSARQVLRNPVAVVVRAEGDPTSVAGSIRGAVAAIDPRLPVYDLRPLDDYLTGARAASRFTMLLATAFAGVALLLAGVGVYGVVAYSVTTRRREFGIRLALGAVPRQIWQLVLGEGLRLTIAGLAVGLTAALALSRLLGNLLYEVSPTDPIAYSSAVFALLAAALIGCWLPVRRAGASDPHAVLRDD